MTATLTEEDSFARSARANRLRFFSLRVLRTFDLPVIITINLSVIGKITRLRLHRCVMISWSGTCFLLTLTLYILLAEPAPSGAQLLSKFGNLSIREILVVTSAYVPRPYSLWGRGRARGVPRQPVRRDGECYLFLAGNRTTLLGNRCFSWREIA